MDIKRLYYTIKRKVWLLILLALIGCGLAIYYNSFFLIPTYRADSTLYIINENMLNRGANNSLSISDLTLSQLIAQNYSDIVHSQRVTSAIVNQLKPSEIPGLSEERIKGIVSVSSQKESNLITVSAVWTDPQTAALISNTASSILAGKINELIGNDYVHILDEAQTPAQPVNGSPARNIMVCMMAGLLVGLGIIYLIALFDTRIRWIDDVKYIEQGLGMQVIGIIPEHKIK